MFLDNQGCSGILCKVSKPCNSLLGWTSEDDVDIEIKFCGFSPFNDVHLANYDWGSEPGILAVAGHEIAGIITKLGSNVNVNICMQKIVSLTYLKLWNYLLFLMCHFV